MKLGVIFLVILVVILLYVVYKFSSGSATSSAFVKLSLSLRNSIFLGFINDQNTHEHIK